MRTIPPVSARRKELIIYFTVGHMRGRSYWRGLSGLLSNQCSTVKLGTTIFVRERHPGRPILWQEDVINLNESIWTVIRLTLILLRVDPNAFRSNRNHSQNFYFNNCNLRRMSSNFLEANGHRWYIRFRYFWEGTPIIYNFVRLVFPSSGNIFISFRFFKAMRKQFVS